MPEAEKFFDENLTCEQKNRAARLLEFIDGFESSFSLELLATIDFLIINSELKSLGEIETGISNWTKRKRNIMKPYFIKVAYQRLEEFGLICN